jgi:hypothetical protein
VKVSTLTAVAAQFVGGQKAQPQPTANKSVAMPGPYSGNGITFSVAPGGASMLNIFERFTYLSCTPSGTINDHLGILQVAIKPNGSFSGKTTQNGVLSGSNAKFTYAIAGSFQAATAATAASAAGTWREDIVFASGTVTSCTSNDQSWTATLYREPAQQRAVAVPGNYSGNGITFSVAPGGKSILNINERFTYLYCTPSATYNDHLAIGEVAIKPDGSFTAKSFQNGLFGGSNAKFTYTFAGYFEGPTPAGTATVAGIWREDVVLASGTTAMCTSNNQSWSATRS